MGLIKTTDAQTLARRALDTAERAERNIRVCSSYALTDMTEGEEFTVGFSGATALQAELSSLTGDPVSAVMTVTAAGTKQAHETYTCNAVIAVKTFSGLSGGRYVFRLTAAGSISAARLFVTIHGGALDNAA